jgi:hypothetical protein
MHLSFGKLIVLGIQLGVVLAIAEIIALVVIVIIILVFAALLLLLGVGIGNLFGSFTPVSWVL